jgi:hypothetical protein
MRPRRLVLCAGVTLFVVFATHRVSAGDPWEVEGGGYGGGGTGHIACGPNVRVAYGGAGGEARYSAARTGDRVGFAGDVGGVVEAQRQWPVDCVNTPNGEDTPGITCKQNFASGVVPTGRARVGLDSAYFGLRAGVLMFGEPKYGQGLRYSPLPDVELRLGRSDGIRVPLGFGAYDLPTYLRPGAYTGLFLPAGGGWDCGVHVGIHYLTQGTLSVRETLTIRAPLTPHLWLRTDFGLTEAQNTGTDSTLSIGTSF